jgi:uncharacterized protein YpbB
MIDKDVIDAFNARPRVDLNNIKKMSPAELDRVKNWGTQAETLLKNRDFAMFVHQFKFEMIDVLAEVRTHTTDDNATRIALSNQLAGIDGFVSMLKRAVYFKDRVVNQQQKELLDPDA